MESFKSDCNFKISQTVGAIDGTHIFIQTPENKSKLITIAGNRGTPLTFKLLLTTVLKTFPMSLLCVLHCITFAN